MGNLQPLTGEKWGQLWGQQPEAFRQKQSRNGGLRLKFG